MGFVHSYTAEPPQENTQFMSRNHYLTTHASSIPFSHCHSRTCITVGIMASTITSGIESIKDCFTTQLISVKISYEQESIVIHSLSHTYIMEILACNHRQQRQSWVYSLR